MLQIFPTKERLNKFGQVRQRPRQMTSYIPERMFSSRIGSLVACKLPTVDGEIKNRCLEGEPHRIYKVTPPKLLYMPCRGKSKLGNKTVLHLTPLGQIS